MDTSELVWKCVGGVASLGVGMRVSGVVVYQYTCHFPRSACGQGIKRGNMEASGE